MIPLIIIGLIVVLPIILALMRRVSSVLLFASLMAGALLLKFLGDDIGLAANAFIKGAQGPMYVQLAILLLPVVLTLLLLKHSVPTSKIALHFVPLLLTGLSIGVLALPMLPSDLQKEIFLTQPGNFLRLAQDDIVGAAVIFNLLLMWLSFRKEHHGGHHGKHHK